MPSATTRTAGTDALDKELDAITAKNTEQDTKLADHEARLKKLESSQSTQPPTQPPVEPPPSGGGGGIDFTWRGKDTVFPSASTTGPRVAMQSSTKMSYSTAGETVTAKKFSGKVQVTAHDVKFVDCEFSGATDWGVDADSRRVTFEYCRFVGGGTSSSQKGAAILGIAKVLYCDVSKFEDGIKLQGNDCIVRGCYIHDPMGQPAGHYDGIQVSGANNNVLIEWNNIKWVDTSAIFTKPDFGPIANVTVTHNRLEGGGFRIYWDNQTGKGLTGGKMIENILVPGGYGFYTVTNCTIQKSGNIQPDGTAVP
jgi:hypothetical protein